MSRVGIITSILDKDISFELLVSWIECGSCGVLKFLEKEEVFSLTFTYTWQELRLFCRQDVFGECDVYILNYRYRDLLKSPPSPCKMALKRWIVAIAVVIRENLSKGVFSPLLEPSVAHALAVRQELRFSLQDRIKLLSAAINNI